MARKQESFVDVLLKAPWWISAILCVVSYVGLRWVIPGMFAQDKILQAIAQGLPNLGTMVAIMFGGIAILSWVFGQKRKELVDQQESLSTLRATPWKDFEYLVAEAYRRQGFTVDFSFGKGADGGVDLVLRKEGRVSLVQCKQWKTLSVGAPVVREMFGILKAGQADEFIIVASGKFTKEAMDFARGKPIRLVDGPILLKLIKSVQTNRRSEAAPISPKAQVVAKFPIQPAIPVCPQCGDEMIERTARRGPNAGQKFFGCRKYPACKGTRGA